ncbi:MAG TPA: CARDB domain-containing protein [Capillimicrobium sp.]|jgi:hypothetical protein
MARTLLAAAALAASLAGAAPAAAADPVIADVEACVGSLVALERSVTLRGEMEATPKTDRMAMRFELYVREPSDAGFVRVDGPGLGSWIRSTSNVGRFIWTKQLTNLEVPAEYRGRVSFRWIGKSGEVLAKSSRKTPVCRQADVRPNIALGRPAAEPGPQPDLVRYAVPVTNSGKGDAPPFDVTLDGRAPVTVSGLKVGDTQTVRFVVPRCTPGQALLFAADGDGLVEETDESDNALRVECPPVAQRR